MSSVAQYSPVYTSDSSAPYSNPIVVTHVVANNNNTEVSTPSFSNNSADLGRVLSTKYLHMINEQLINESAAQTPSTLQQNIDSEPEVELLITDQNTGIMQVIINLG